MVELFFREAQKCILIKSYSSSFIKTQCSYSNKEELDKFAVISIVYVHSFAAVVNTVLMEETVMRWY